MKYIAHHKDLTDVKLAGGKGHHLQKLNSWGANVPTFFVITTIAYDYFLENERIPEKVEDEFKDFLRSYPRVALRSSMILEDDADSSFAGLFETRLDIHADNWKEGLLSIYQSLKSDRVTEYLSKKNIVTELKMAVVVQELIEVERSGVLFTRSPVSPTASVAIDAAFGMGEGVVSGHSDVDHYQVTRNLQIINKRVATGYPVLKDREISELVALGLKLEKFHRTPSDIEWGIKDQKFYIFQIRPITRSFPPLYGLVDTNLSESYPGTVSPFTAAFIKKAYENVFKESAIILGASGKRFDDLSFHYERLITCVDGHLYYNLEHYYAVLRALPGGERNISNWHKMIGGNIENLEIHYHDTKLMPYEFVLAIKELFYLIINRKKVFGKLLSDLDQLKNVIEAEAGSLKSPEEIISYMSRLIERPNGFGFTIVNDIFVMMGLGVLSSLLKKKNIPETILIDLLKTDDHVDSVKPLEALNVLAANLSEATIKKLADMDLRPGLNPYDEAFSQIDASQTDHLKSFLAHYGERSFEELKLESLPLKNNPQELLKLIKWARVNPSRVTIQPDQNSDIDLGWFGTKVLAFTRESIATREATRLWRGKFYHLLRNLVLNLGTELQKKPEWKEFSILDFFSVTHNEWLTLSEHEIRLLMIERKKWQTNKTSYPEVICWTEFESLPSTEESFSMGDIQGQGVSAGISEGVVLVLDNPLDALSTEIKDFILITKNTDPAWVYIMSRSKGLISEKGSLLSHTAIIGRELNIPTVVGVKQATSKIKTGQRIKIDGTKGLIEIL